MRMHEFMITIIYGGQRIERRIVATCSIDATIVGMLMSPEAKGPLSVFCKPVERITA